MKSQYRTCNKTKQPLQKPLSQIMQLEEIIPIINIRLNVVGKWLPCLYKTIHYNFQNIESRITFQICEVSSIISKYYWFKYVVYKITSIFCDKIISEIKKVSLTQMVHVGLSSLFYCTIFSFLYSYLWRNLNNSCPVNWAATFNNRMITSYHISKTNKPYDIFILFAAKEERYCQSSSFNDSHVHK